MTSQVSTNTQNLTIPQIPTGDIGTSGAQQSGDSSVISQKHDSFLDTLQSKSIDDVKADMNQLKSELGTVKANVVITKALINLKEGGDSRFPELNKAVLEQKQEWVGDLCKDCGIPGHQSNESFSCDDTLCTTYAASSQNPASSRVNVFKTTVTLADLTQIDTNNPEAQIKELTGTCGTISCAQALAKPDISPENFMKLMTAINHYSDLNDKPYVDSCSDGGIHLADREAQPGNKDLGVIAKGLSMLGSEKMEPLGQYIKDDVVLALTIQDDTGGDTYDFDAQTGKAQLLCCHNSGGDEGFSVVFGGEDHYLSTNNLQLINDLGASADSRAEDGLASKGMMMSDWDDLDFSDQIQNESDMVHLIVPSQVGHYIMVEHNTMEAKVNAFESNKEVSPSLRSTEFAGITFPCDGSPRNNLPRINIYLESTPQSSNDAFSFIQAFETIGNAMEQSHSDIDYLASSKTLTGAYSGRTDMDLGTMGGFIENADRFDALMDKVSVSTAGDPMESNEISDKMNLMLGIFKADPENRIITNFKSNFEGVMSKQPSEITQSDADSVKKNLDMVDTDFLKQVYADVK